MGYANGGTVYRIVSEELKAQTVEAVEQLRNLEVARLDKLQLCGLASRHVRRRARRIRGHPGHHDQMPTARPGGSLCVLGVDAVKPRTLVVPQRPDAEAWLPVLCCCCEKYVVWQRRHLSIRA